MLWSLRQRAQQGAFMFQSLSGIRTIKSLALDAKQRHMWDVHVARVAKARIAEGLMGVAIQTVVQPLERLAVSLPYAVGVYLAITTSDPVYLGALFAFLMLSQRVAGPLMQMAQLVNQFDEAQDGGRHCRPTCQSPARRGAVRSWREDGARRSYSSSPR